MAAVLDKLGLIAGTGKLYEREWRIRCRLNWHTKPKSAVRHLLYGERRPTLEEAQQIEAAHLKATAEKVKANAAENEVLFRTMRAALAAMETSDADFHRNQIEAMRELLLQHGNGSGETRIQD